MGKGVERERVGEKLPKGWKTVRLGDVCDINPTRPRALGRADDAPTSFVPMPAVDARLGQITKPEVRLFAEVRKGYTYFEENDVLFAKITPCMENGKHSIAHNLIDGFGFGTTEFHVLRASSVIMPDWIYRFLRQPKLLKDAVEHFSGSVGQQRLPADYLSNLEIPLPPLLEQKRIVGILSDRLSTIEQARAATEAQLEAAKALPAAYLRQVFDSPEAQTWKRKKLGDVLELRREVIHPRNKPQGSATFVGLEHIQSLTGIRIGSLAVEMAELTGRKPQFYKGDIVYGYLRPYLNKVWLAEFDGLCSVDQYVFSTIHTVADSNFVAWFMRSPVYLNRAPIGDIQSQLPRIRTDEVMSVDLNLPSLEKQKQIVKEIAEKLSETERLRQSLQSQLDTIRQLPAALLRQAFNGEL